VVARERRREAPAVGLLNEVAGGRKLLQAVRERTDQISEVIVAAPQNQPTIGTLIDREELYASARARVEVDDSCRRVRHRLGREVLDPAPQLALGDAIRAMSPPRSSSRRSTTPAFGSPARTWSSGPRAGEPEVRFTTSRPRRRGRDPPRPQPRAGRRDQDRRRADLVARLKERPRCGAPLHDHLPARRGRREDQVIHDLASTLAELYRATSSDWPADHQPRPLRAVRNAIEHYKIDEILISTFAASSRAGSRAT